MLPFFEPVSDGLNKNRVISFINRKHECGSMAPSHWHICSELLYVFSGSATQTINGISFELNEGDSLLIAQGDTHSTVSIEDDCYILVIQFFQEVTVSSILLRTKNDVFEKIENTHMLPRIFTQINEEMTFQKIGWSIIFRGLLWQVLGYMEREGEIVVNHNEEVDLTYQISMHMKTKLTTELSLSSVATHFGYTQSYFSKLFPSLMGVPFKVYVDQLKVQAAKELLAQAIPVQEVALTLCYDTPSSFCRAFKRITGQTPSSIAKSGQ